MEAFAEISEAGDRIEVHFPYHKEAVKAIKRVPGYRFVPREKGGPYWRLPLDLTSGRRLREGFGDGLKLGEGLREWGKQQVEKDRNLRSLSSSDDAELTLLPEVLPELAEFLHSYQRADAAFMAHTSSINANHPGTGKTVATIAAMFESGLGDGPHLIVAPVTSLDTVWKMELERFCPHPVLTGETPDERKAAIAQAEEMAAEGEPFFLVVNPDMVRYQRNKKLDKIIVRGKEEFPTEPKFPFLFKQQWNTVVVDEYHKMGLSNDKTLTFKAANDLKADRKFLLSGTPMGGKPIKLWGALHFLDPGSFTSKWRWADTWLTIETKDIGNGREAKEIQGIREEREDEFYEALAPYLVRRTKAEVMPELPAKQPVHVMCKMTPKQQEQYDSFAADAEIKIEEEHLSATSILAEYTRLKQFASARCKVNPRIVTNSEGEEETKYRMIATEDSGKLPYLWERLEERAIVGDEVQPDGESAVVGTQFKEMADMVTKWLESQGVHVAKITGDVKGKDRKDLVDAFQSDDPNRPRVMVVTTTAAGLSITLDKADSVHVLDETWNPDDQEQLEDRIHRVSRIHNVTCYYYRSKETLEEYIHDITTGKMDVNRAILDMRRKGFRALKR